MAPPAYPIKLPSPSRAAIASRSARFRAFSAFNIASERAQRFRAI